MKAGSLFFDFKIKSIGWYAFWETIYVYISKTIIEVCSEGLGIDGNK